MDHIRNRACEQAVVLFTRYPQAGKVKTRLIKRLGPQGAADLHTRMTKQVIRGIEPALRTGSLQLRICYCGGSEQEMRDWLKVDAAFFPQHGKDLGERMLDAFNQGWKQGRSRILIIGSDCPSLDATLIDAALQKLDGYDLVLGPAADGGYYLIGLRASDGDRACLFDAVDWGTERVLRQTEIRAKRAGISYALLPQLYDIDCPEDLVHCRDILAVIKK